MLRQNEWCYSDKDDPLLSLKLTKKLKFTAVKLSWFTVLVPIANISVVARVCHSNVTSHTINFKVNKYESEKNALQKDVANLTTKLVEAKVTICDSEEENVSFVTTGLQRAKSVQKGP